MKFAAVQWTSGSDTEDNARRLGELVREAADAGADVVVAPEASSQAFGTGRLDTQAQGLDGPFATGLRELAEELGVLIVAGMFLPADTVERDGKRINRVDNAALITGRGHHLAYRKIHTYDAFSYRESDTVRPGCDDVIVDVDGLKLGLAICYDVRFPEHFVRLARAGAEVMVLPASWAGGPGKLDAWRTLVTARALDSVSYVVAADQARLGTSAHAGDKEDTGPTGIGHSMIVDPTGAVRAEAGAEPTIIYADVSADLVAETRAALPVLDAR
ncbi:carbon-nitrogen hydrolase family protein [Corynebacterium uterequi]|uniref:Putative amidohydrolase n=1 Tax=Corynebacterium uterequi TaxID=1072256 RepID=A0A0G3HLD7_9CORY|nr:carbon-nitrogen hydrolase family protein [Corynebacterium uterequi]AKK11942.1 putative amidohydrolase [Corynebacterium uterequi]